MARIYPFVHSSFCVLVVSLHIARTFCCTCVVCVVRLFVLAAEYSIRGSYVPCDQMRLYYITWTSDVRVAAWCMISCSYPAGRENLCCCIMVWLCLCVAERLNSRNVLVLLPRKKLKLCVCGCQTCACIVQRVSGYFHIKNVTGNAFLSPPMVV